MVNEKGWSGFERRPDVDRTALRAILRRVLGPGLRVTRTSAGVAAQVYRVQAPGRVLYLRIAEEDHEDLSGRRRAPGTPAGQWPPCAISRPRRTLRPDPWPLGAPHG
jgi:hypothetical protein